MARVGGRNVWIAVPVGALCAGVVGILAFLAQPMLPHAAAWVGETLRTATTHTAPTPKPPTVDTFATAVGSDCRSLYPDGLWADLTWTPEARLAQDQSPPVLQEESVTAALAPSVRVTCTWKAEADRSITTTVAEVGADAEAVAQTALSVSGFACETTTWLQCVRERDGVTEVHLLRGGLWISTVERAWHPEEYSARIAAHVWG